MTAIEKQQLYITLATISSWAYKCPAPGFDETPIFTDDIVSKTSCLEKIEKKIALCNRCKLCTTRTKTVSGEGVEKPLVLVIGEAPGADEDLTGKPFVGKAGQLLDKMLAAISLSRNTNCFIANIVKCRPPANRDPLPEEIDSCSSFLQAQIATLKPVMILALGRISAQVLLNTKEGIGKLRGKFFEYNKIPLMATYHPSALLRDAQLKRPAWEDLKQFRTKLTSLIPDYEKSFNQEISR